MSLSIKFALFHNGNPDPSNLKYDAILDAFYSASEKNVKSELANALSIMIKARDQSKEIKSLEELLKNLSTFDINDDAKNKLTHALEINKRCYLTKSVKKENNSSRNNYKGISKPKVVVTKTQQKVKNKCKNTQSEEADMQILSIADALKNRKKTLNQNKNQDIIPANVEEGSDR